jgi:S-adenosylmethionine hydrolase
MHRPIITLTTDFGTRDPYVAEMKAVILRISPNAVIVDLTHQIERFNVRMGAYILASASPYFPEGTIHVAVVDPGVGSKRRPLIIKTETGCFVGPDNGILALATRGCKTKQVHEMANRKLMLPKVSNTFHGRDIFAPAAAHIANGTALAEFGPEISEIMTPEFAKVATSKDSFVGEVVHIDNFGNIITNIGTGEVDQLVEKHEVNVKIKNARLKLSLCKTYAEVEAEKLLALIGSHNLLEISMNQGNAAENLRVRSGDKITLYRS